MSEVMTVAQRVRKIIAESLAVDPTSVTDDKKLSDMGGDSLDAVETVMSLEDELGLEVTDEDGEKLAAQPVKEWVQYFEARMAALHA